MTKFQVSGFTFTLPDEIYLTVDTQEITEA